MLERACTFAVLGCMKFYMFSYFESEGVSHATEQFEFEWLAAALNAIYVGLMPTLLLVDPVDDELRAFFCCRLWVMRIELFVAFMRMAI